MCASISAVALQIGLALAACILIYNALAFPPPNGPGLRVKLYPSEKRRLSWPMGMGGGTVGDERGVNLLGAAYASLAS